MTEGSMGEDARALNRERRAQAVKKFVSHSLSADQVIDLLGLKGGSKLFELVYEGQLMARAESGVTWFPSWQFTLRDIRDDLGPILECIRKYTTDVLAADRVMRMGRFEIDGSLAEALDENPFHEEAWRILHTLGGG